MVLRLDAAEPGQAPRLLDEEGRPLSGWRARGWAWLGVRRWPAVVVPEELVLRRTWWQPPADEKATAAAALWRARSESPYAADDTLFIWRAEPQAQGQKIHGVWLSRSLLQRSALASMGQRVVWLVPNPADADRYQFVPGSGWAALQRWRRRWMVLTGLAWLLALSLTAAAALTPSWQLRQRAHDAQALWNDLAARAEPALAARLALTTALEAVQAYDQQVASRPDPVAVLNWLHERSGDDTYITELELDGEVLRVSGFTPNAVALQQAWSNQPGLAQITATRAATRSAATGKESFQFELRFAATPVLTQP
ncbi:hypothetical protein [Tepidimonas alkaliphilus]|nr:hypothetical protein [Tepidimonas alkaliphilus]